MALSRLVRTKISDTYVVKVPQIKHFGFISTIRGEFARLL